MLNRNSSAATIGGPQASAYTLLANQALPNTAVPTREGPDGTNNGALEFNGSDSFGFIEHSSALEMTQGTIALWVQPDDVSDDSIILSKDQSGTGDGGHFRLGIEDDGRIFIRFAEGDGGSNKAWTSSKAYFSDGQWTHVAVSFTEDGITEIARLASEINEKVENIGARRLHTVMERLVEDISFEATDREGDTLTIDPDYVREKVGQLVEGADLSKFIL